MKRFFPLMCALFCAFPLLAQDDSLRIVASTTWTAAIVRAAGGVDVRSIAPAELKHPPEYEPKPADLLAVSKADLVVYSGYEKFAQRLVEACGASGALSLQVNTDNIPSTLVSESKKVAELLGLRERKRQAAWAKGFLPFTDGVRQRVMAAWPARKAAVQAFLKTYAEWLGFEVVGVFGPEEPSPAQMLAIMKSKPDLVIDNYHNPSGAALAESLKLPYAVLVNFPGKDGSASLEDVFSLNEKALTQAARR